MSALAGARSMPMWRAFGVRDFRLLWASEAISVLGDQFHYIALAWLVISLTGSGLALGAVLIAVAVPRAVLIVPFGVLADRRPARGLMVTAHVARGVIVGVIAALAMNGMASVPALVVLGVLFGAADALYMPAQQAFLPRTVEANRLPSANALLHGTLQLSSMVGPPLAGIVIAIAGTGTAFAVDAVSFFVAALVILLMGPATARQMADPGDGVAAPVGTAPVGTALAPTGRSFRAELVDGIRYVAADPAIRTLLLLAMVLNFALNGPAGVGMPWLAQQRFDAGPMGLAAMEAGWAAGALVGIMLAGNVRLERQGRAVVAAVAGAGVQMGAVGMLGSLPGVGVALAAMGATIGYVNVVAVSWLQGRVQPTMVGRVMSIVMLMSFGITPLSLGLSGALIDLNATALFVGAGVLTVACAVFAVAVRLPAMLDERPVATGS
ncbi:MAG: MFS transporter [Chloroflexi bacterium]|nr:MFS transporter [Chloroflexota bacterium]